MFSGRACRSEYWMFFFFNTIIQIMLAYLDVAAGLADAERGAGPVLALYCLAVLIPTVAVSVRRLHDTGHSGWWMLLGLIPLIGTIVLLFFMVRASQPGPNEYGPNPNEALVLEA